jgi:hypothetical protein
MTELVRYEEMRRAIAAAHKIDEVKAIHDKAAALEHYARLSKDTKQEELVAEIRIRAADRMGKLLEERPKAKGTRGRGRPKLGGARTEPPKEEQPKTLAELGITKKQAAAAQKLAAMPRAKFEAAMAEPGKPTINRILNHGAADDEKLVFHKDALRLASTLRDFERQGWLNVKLSDIWPRMLDVQKADVKRLAPQVAAWLMEELPNDD